MNQQRIDKASETLTRLGRGHDFGRGVVALREMLRTESAELHYNGPWSRPDVSGNHIAQAARALLIVGIDRDFERGVLALSVAILPQTTVIDLLDSAATMRARLPATELDGLFLKEVECSV